MSKSHNKLDNDLKKQSLKGLLSLAGVADNERLSKLSSGKPYRYTLAFFVPENRITSQVTDTDSIKPLNPITGLNRHTYVHSVPSYGGVTLLNKKAERQIGRAVATKTESEPRHPIYGVVLTQKLVGGYHA